MLCCVPVTSRICKTFPQNVRNTLTVFVLSFFIWSVTCALFGLDVFLLSLAFSGIHIWFTTSLLTYPDTHTLALAHTESSTNSYGNAWLQTISSDDTHTPSIFKTLLDAVCWEAAFANGSLTVNQLMCRAELKRCTLLSSHYPPCARPVTVWAPLHR